MPIYEYECKSCGVFEYLQRTNDVALKKCPMCSEPVEQKISAPGYFDFHGDGFYETDYKRGKTKKVNKDKLNDR